MSQAANLASLLSGSNLSLVGNATLGDESSDSLNIYGSTVSIPNNLNFDSNTLFIDSANNRVILGANSSIGTSSARLQMLSSANPGFSIASSTTPTNNVSFAGWDGWAYDGSTYFAAATINFRADENWSSTNHGSLIQFRTTTSGSGGTLSEKMRIDSSGNVGIGTTSPSYKIDVNKSSAGSAARFTASADGGRGLSFTSADNGIYLGAIWTRDVASAYGIHAWSINSSEKMRIDSGGSLLVATTTDPVTGTFPRPAISLKQSNTTSYGGMHIEAYLDQSVLGIGYDGTAFDFNTSYRGTGAYRGISLSTSNARRLLVNPSGRIGINTTSQDTNPDQVSIVGNYTSKYTLHLSAADWYTGSSYVAALRIDGYNPRGQGTHTGISIDINEIDVGLCYGVNSKVTGTYLNQYCYYADLVKNLGAYTSAYCNYAKITTTNSGGAAYFYFAEDAGTTRFYVKQNGGIANYSANDTNLSDIREKKDIELADAYLDKICSIPVKTFRYIDQPEEDLERTLGVIAQDVQSVAPELVSEDNWGSDNEDKPRLSIYQTDLQYALMKCIQELRTEIESQNVLNQSLLERIALLEEK